MEWNKIEITFDGKPLEIVPVPYKQPDDGPEWNRLLWNAMDDILIRAFRRVPTATDIGRCSINPYPLSHDHSVFEFYIDDLQVGRAEVVHSENGSIIHTTVMNEDRFPIA
jgi:hypothetical protein